VSALRARGGDGSANGLGLVVDRLGSGISIGGSCEMGAAGLGGECFV
jgi:hypothetical protein